MTLKSDVKFEEKLNLGFKNDMRNLVNFNASSGKSENLRFDVLLLSNIWSLSQKNPEELCVITLNNDAKFEEELTCTLKNDMRNLANFDPILESLKICTLTGSFWLSKERLILEKYAFFKWCNRREAVSGKYF